MQQRPLGSTGLTVSELGFGCGSVGGLMVRGEPADQLAAVRRALDGGVTYFDTAPSYGDGLSEQNLGRVLAELGVRERVVVGTKLRLIAGDLSDPAAAVRASLEASLRRLRMDHVDLIQVHNPLSLPPASGQLSADDLTGGVIEALRGAIAAGLARFAGFTGLGEPRAVMGAARSARFDTMQSYFNVLNPSSGFAGRSGGAQDYGGVIDEASARGMGVLAIRVFAAGALAGTTLRAPNASAIGSPLSGGSEFQQDVERAQRLLPLCRELGAEGTVELGLRFVLAKSGVSTALAGISTLQQLDAALRWTEKGPLGAAEMQRVLDVLAA